MFRPNKRKSPKVVRVDSVEVYQQGSNDELFKGIISDIEKEQDYITFHDIEVQDDHEYFANDVLVHNCHRCAAFDSRYMRVMQNSFSPARFGVTATLPNKPEGKIALEAAIGPVIDSFTINDGIEMGILSKPKIIFVPYKGALFSGEMKTYRDIYEKNIVQSVSRNNKIAKLAKTFADKGESSLIFVRQVDHGNRISEILKKLGVEHLWVSGVSEKEERMRTKEALEDKNIKVVICSTIWNEGISIKSLNNCILAAGGKDEKMVLQVVGRGTRVTETKKTVKIWDFLDPQKYLSQHCIERMIVYREQGWQVSILKKKIGG